jgi:chromosome condensin MukBEF ATPase and DNA-binding subunit MukB
MDVYEAPKEEDEDPNDEVNFQANEEDIQIQEQELEK